MTNSEKPLLTSKTSFVWLLEMKDFSKHPIYFSPGWNGLEWHWITTDANEAVTFASEESARRLMNLFPRLDAAILTEEKWHAVQHGFMGATHETGALPHASAALKAFMSELGEIMSMEDGATPAEYLQRARDIREWCHDHQTCAACLEAQTLITDFDSEIPDGDVPDRLGDLLPTLRSAADAVDMVRTATLLHERNCECEACYWIGRSPLAQQQANAQKAGDQHGG